MRRKSFQFRGWDSDFSHVYTSDVFAIATDSIEKQIMQESQNEASRWLADTKKAGKMCWCSRYECPQYKNLKIGMDKKVDATVRIIKLTKKQRR